MVGESPTVGGGSRVGRGTVVFCGGKGGELVV